MNCQDIQNYCIEFAGEKLRPDVEQHLASCEACRKVHAQSVLVCKLISLKKYEQPDPGFEARSLARIRSAIEEVNEQRSHGWRFWEAFGAGPIPALRYALAAAVLVLTGLNFVSVQNLPTLRSIALEEPAPARTEVVASSSNGATQSNLRPSAPFMLVASNRQPGLIQYGTGPSIPVNFEY